MPSRGFARWSLNGGPEQRLKQPVAYLLILGLIGSLVWLLYMNIVVDGSVNDLPGAVESQTLPLLIKTPLPM